MATLISRGNDLGFTILPYTLDKPLPQELLDFPSDYVLGFITYNGETNERKFTYTESGALTATDNHWSLSIMKEMPYIEQKGPWIVYRCAPEKTKSAFSKIVSKYSQSLFIYNWDTWTVAGKEAIVAVVTSWEIF